jgi:TonB-linked SusC/RagA family outer membrane protein
MKYTILKYNLSIILIVLFSLCFSPLINSQTPARDSVDIRKVPAVNIAYGSQPAWMVTSAVSKISGIDIQYPFTTDFPGRLYGKIPGLSVVAGGAEPGNQRTSAFIRGVNTFGVGGTAILILVDGIESNYADLVPEEIESVTLLKDASATAMYGSRGANGVLLVTTKRGREGDLKVVFSTQQGVQNATRLPQFLDSYDYARLYNEALVNDGFPELYTAADLDAYKNGNDPYFHPNVNWYKEILRRAAPISNYNLNFSGGNNSVRYFVLLNQINNNNLYRKTGDESQFSINGSYRRINFRSNVDIDITRRLSAAITIGGTVVDKANPVASTTNDVFNQLAKLPPNSFPTHNPNNTWSRNSPFSNPLGDILNSGFYTSNGRTLQTTFGFTEQLDFLLQGLSITSRISFNSYFLSQSNKSRTYESFALSRDLEGATVYTKYGLNTSLVGSEGASDQFRNIAFQSFLNYDRTLGVNTLNGVLMYNADEYTISGNNEPVKHINVSGRATFSNNEKYIGELSFSYMGSGNFPPDKRFGFFPAVSLGWIVSNEGFLKDNSMINFLKLRGSFGMVGNDKIGGTAYMYQQYYPYTSSYNFGTNNASFSSIIQGSPANRTVTWEKEKSINIGFEATLMNHVDVSLDLFNRDRYDILVQPNLTEPDFMGFTKPYLNQGKANNKGFEARLGFHNDQSKNLRFFVDASVWYFHNKIVYNSEALQMYDYLYRTGLPIGQPFGLVATGFFKDQEDIAQSPKQLWTAVKPGDVKYMDQNGDGIINQNDYYPIGKTGLPNFTAGLNTGFWYKGFDFVMFFQGVTSRTVSFDGYYFEAFQNNGQAGMIALDRWTPATAASATYPRLSTLNDDNNFRYSTLWQKDGSFIKLRSLEIGYTLPARISDMIKMSSARVFLNGTDLFSIDHMQDYRDPEIGSGYPAVRSISVGVRVQFK